jgi:hypothetical protein
MQLISDRDAAHVVLNDPNFMVPPVPPGTQGIA